MVQAQQPLFPSATPVTRSLPENPTSDLALALPSLAHLTKALYAHALASSQQDCATSSRRHGHGKSDRHGCVGRDRRLPSRDRRERRTDSCERRASTMHHHREAKHVSIETRMPALEPQTQPATTFETSSPRRKTHYVPAMPSGAAYSPQANYHHELKQQSPTRAGLPTPPSSAPSSSPKQRPLLPPKRFSAPELHLPPPPPSQDVATVDAALSKFRRFVLACRETSEDEDRISALIDSYDQIMGSLVDEVVMDSASDSE
jgi:hypothetical protein